MKLKCSACGSVHKNTTSKFPVVLKQKQEIFTGSGKKRKSLGIQDTPVGYLCLKCVAKDQKKKLEEDYKNKILNEKQYNIGIEALKKKILIYNNL
jgi:hypothetical protein